MKRQPAARRGLDQVQNLFAFAETIKEDGHGAEIQGVRAEPNQVRCDALKFAHQHANRLSTLGNLELQELLDRHYIRELLPRGFR